MQTLERLRIKIRFVLIASLMTTLHCHSQSGLEKDSNELQGVWIAEAYYNAFEKNKSAIASLAAFDRDALVGLTINPKEIHDEKLSVTFSTLSGHMLQPEVSTKQVLDKNVYTQVTHFELALSAKDSVGYYKTSPIIEFGKSVQPYIKFDTDEKCIFLYTYKGSNSATMAKPIKYVRIEKNFKKDNPYPNPLYYYLRERALTGNYILKDANDKTLSKHFTITNGGHMKGYPDLDKKSIFYNTDHYEPGETQDNVIIVEDPGKLLGNNSLLLDYERINDYLLHLYRYVYDSEKKQSARVLMYELLRKK